MPLRANCGAAADVSAPCACCCMQVTVDGKLIHSKLKGDGFSNEAMVLKAIEYAAANGGTD